MDKLLTFEFEQVQNSIVTPNSNSYGDFLAPYSFIEFLKNTNNNYTPKVYNEFYIDYIKRWNVVKGDLSITNEELVLSQYTDLLRDISLTYSTLEERRFLSNIDFSNSEDLEIAIPFFSRKIKEIILLYKSSRDRLTFQLEKVKRKGTESSVELALKDTISQVLLNSSTFSTLGIDLSTVNVNIDIDMDNLVDTFGSYFNLKTPPPTYGSPLREEQYSSNVNDIDYTNYIDLEEFLKTNVFNQTFITEVGKSFTINVNVTYDPICDPNNPIGEFLDEQTIAGVTPEQYSTLRGEFVKNIMGVDYHYVIKNTDNQVLSGVLFRAKNPVANLLNVENASTATVPSDDLTSLKKAGLYFTNHKQSVIRLNKTKNSYKLDFDGLVPGVTYVYPDPAICGKMYDNHYPVLFQYDNTSVFKNTTQGAGFGDPNTSSREQNYYGYYSRQQTYDTSNFLDNNLKSAFSSLYDDGYIQDWKKDVYGNEFGLFKDEGGQFYKGVYSFTEVVDGSNIVKLLPFNGWVFYDSLSGYNFDYEESGVYSQFENTVRSGINTFGGDLSSSSFDYYLNFRSFYPYVGIPSEYNLYPELNVSDLLKTTPSANSKTIVSSSSGNSLSRLLTLRNTLTGSVYVKNSITGNVTTLSGAMKSTFDKYPAAVKSEIYNDCTGIDVFYDNIVITTPNYVVFEKIAFNETGFIQPTTFNNYLSTTYLPYQGISNLFFNPGNNYIFFFITKKLDYLGEDNNKVVYPEIYYFDIDKHQLKRVFPSNRVTITSLSGNFTFLNTITGVNIVSVDSQKIAYNKTSDLYVINYMGKDGNLLPYLYDIKFKYDGEDVVFKYYNVYECDSSRITTNFYTITSNNVYVSNSTGPGSIITYSSFNYNISSNSGNSIVLNTTGGYIQL